MRILLSNDDGYFAEGLKVLAEHIGKIAEITVIAPERDHSGASNSLTLDRPLSVKQAPNGFFYVNGTPTDCVHLAVTGFLDFVPDMIISGINSSANLGDDTLYSGTVAAATEGYLLGIPSMAFSLATGTEHSKASNNHYESAAKIACQLIAQIQQNPPQKPILLTVNVPDLPFNQIKEKVITRLGRRHPAEGAIKVITPRGQTTYWIGAAGVAKDAGIGTDFHAIANNQVSITPLQVDLTHHEAIHTIKEWLL